MYFNRSEYLEIIDFVDKVKDGLKTAFSQELLKRRPDLKTVEERSDYEEERIIYAVFENSYDPRVGKTFIAYIKNRMDFDAGVFLESLGKFFGEFSILNKKDYKYNNITNYHKDAKSIIFLKEIYYNVKFQIIIGENPKSYYKLDEKKYAKFLDKEPHNVIY